MFVATFVCGVVVTLTSRVSPYGWKGRHTQRYDKENSEHKETKDALNCENAAWFALASLVLVVSDTALF